MHIIIRTNFKLNFINIIRIIYWIEIKSKIKHKKIIFYYLTFKSKENYK